MQGVTLRDAVPQDCPAILRLIKDHAVYAKESESVVWTTAEILERDCFGENPWFYCMVAEREGTLIAYSLYFHAYSTWKGRMLYLEDIFVDPNERKKGIGIGMMKELCKVAVEKKCYKIKWSVLDWNQSSIDFYNALGAEIEHQWKLVCLDNSAMLTLSAES